MKRLLLSVAASLVFASQSFACDIPASAGNESLYGSTSSREGIDRLNSGFRDQVAAMIAAANAEFGGNMTIYSGYRSIERQRELYQDALRRYGSEREARRWVAPPGNSMHNYGLAVDLRHNGSTIQYGSAISDWMSANMGRFGLTRPLGNEGWHVEPIGGRANRDNYMGGTSAECQEAFENGINEIPYIILMPWDGSGGVVSGY